MVCPFTPLPVWDRGRLSGKVSVISFKTDLKKIKKRIKERSRKWNGRGAGGGNMKEEDSKKVIRWQKKKKNGVPGSKKSLWGL